MADGTEKWTRQSFKTAYEEERDAKARFVKERDQERAGRQEAEARNKELQQQFADLKVRLHAAESANQYMRGYLARVQEDDTVREELITTGDPEGEQIMRPKRKATEFPRPDDFTAPARHDDMGMWVDNRERKRRAKHWITY